MWLQIGDTFYCIVPGFVAVTAVLIVFLTVGLLDMDCMFILISSSSWLESRNGKTRHHLILLHTGDHKLSTDSVSKASIDILFYLKKD